MKLNKKAILYLTHFSIIVYTLIRGDEMAKTLALFVLGIWVLAVNNWRKSE